MSAMRAIKRRPAKAPARRTVHVLIEDGEYAGWECTALADFKARWYGDMQSDSVDRILGVLDKIVVDHNFPDAENPDEVAASLGDVDNEALKVVAGNIFDAIGKLPNR